MRAKEGTILTSTVRCRRRNVVAIVCIFEDHVNSVQDRPLLAQALECKHNQMLFLSKFGLDIPHFHCFTASKVTAFEQHERCSSFVLCALGTEMFVNHFIRHFSESSNLVNKIFILR